MQKTFVLRVSRGLTGLACWLVSIAPAAASAPDIQTLVGTGRDQINPVSGPLQTNIGNPFGVEFGPDGDLYICEVSNHRVWQLTDDGRQLSVVAGTGQAGYSGDGGPAVQAQLNEPYEVRFDGEGNLYVVEMQNHIVRRIERRSGIIATIAGNGSSGFGGDGGPATQAQLSQPHSIALDQQGYLYIADIGNHRIRRVNLQTGIIDSIAGNDQRRLPTPGQPALGQPVLGPRALFIAGRELWVALREGHSVWRLNLDQGTWQHVAGTGQAGYSGDGGPARAATFNGPKGIALDQRGDVYVVDTENQAIRHISRSAGIIQTLAGSGPTHRGYAGDGGPARKASLNRPHGVCATPDGRRIVIGDSENHRVRQVRVEP